MNEEWVKQDGNETLGSETRAEFKNKCQRRPIPLIFVEFAVVIAFAILMPLIIVGILWLKSS